MPGTREIFTIRFWTESVNPEQTEWRGKVHHIRSSKVRYFRDWQTLVKFVSDVLSQSDLFQIFESVPPVKYVNPPSLAPGKGESREDPKKVKWYHLLKGHLAWPKAGKRST